MKDVFLAKVVGLLMQERKTVSQLQLASVKSRFLVISRNAMPTVELAHFHRFQLKTEQDVDALTHAKLRNSGISMGKEHIRTK
jgi:hypothetical protein